ncbi:HAD family hydrolase [Streptomyces sp. H27-D2]|uniref:HAD family hydrolase n=1 Tax=Streptomyces sp. H27-D2 TaxID=3046304 RepID=UPI002DBA0268|nr:HAD hydrolase-like protein [Streptomyces sp. H27-D2]MEC4018771.1 HAD hydrolase-like protein [Streptomyces sp. H27-D2]
MTTVSAAAATRATRSPGADGAGAGFGAGARCAHDAGGSPKEERPDLVAIALQRAGRQREGAVLVGDTPADVRAGLKAGVRVVAVATGRSSRDDLRATGAHDVLADLVDTERVVQVLAPGG